MRAALPGLDRVSEAEVAAFLRAHPHFLADNPALYSLLSPPARVHGEALADHMTAMLRAARTEAAAMAERADDVLAAGRASAGLALRVQAAVLALMRTDDTADCVASEWPALLAVDAASLCAEAEIAGMHSLPLGTVARLLSTRPALFRAGAEDAEILHGEAAHLARHEALVLVPGEGPPMLIALVVRDGRSLDPSQGTGALAFLGGAVAAALRR